MIHDRVTDVGTGVDTAVRRISTVYSINGQVERLTSWDNAAVGNGSIVNEVRYEYNQYGLLGKEYSNPVGSADMSLFTEYFYDASKSGEYFTNGFRPIGVTYPSGDTVTYSYGQTGLADDLLNRPVSVLYNNVVQATYEYQGLQTPITTTYPVPNLSLDYSNALDLYNRIIKQNWKNSNGESVVDIQHGYDRSGNRLNRIDAVGGTAFNELYSYDGMNQLINKSMESSFERFHYDAAGNHVQTTTDSAVETQTFNKANEIIAINNNSNAVSNDRNGNMTRIPGKDLTYDAWNRLVCVTHNGLTVAQYQYNALNHRVIKTTPFETRYYYFNRNWQCLEEYADNSATPDITYVWGLRYIDDMICRICSSETLYPIADANWNTVALANSSGSIVERYSYDAFGTLHIYDASFNERVASNYFWTRAFTGQVLDLDTGLMLYRNRYYSPSMGRFITRDPIGYEGNDENLYRQTFNLINNGTDEMGLTSGWIPTDTTCAKQSFTPIDKCNQHKDLMCIVYYYCRKGYSLLNEYNVPNNPHERPCNDRPAPRRTCVKWRKKQPIPKPHPVVIGIIIFGIIIYYLFSPLKVPIPVPLVASFSNSGQ